MKQDFKKLYNKYVKNKYFNRIVSNEYLPKIKKKGLTPKEHPFKKIKKELQRFYTLVENLERKGYKIIVKWAFENVPGSRVTKVHRKNLITHYIDLNPNFKHSEHYSKRRGGDLAFTTKYLAKEVIRQKFPLNKEQRKLVNSILKWCDKKSKYKMSTLLISRKSPYLEEAHFQHFTGGKYWPSPFGRFEHFKKVISKEGLKKYKPFLEGGSKKVFYLRLTKRVPASEIKVIK